MHCSSQQRSSVPTAQGRVPRPIAKYARCLTARISVPFLFLCILVPELAANTPIAPKEWRIRSRLGGIELYKAIVEGGARANQTDGIDHIDSKLMAALNHISDNPIPYINVEAMLSRVILQQQPQQAIDAAFNNFPRPSSSSSTSQPDTVEDTASVGTQPLTSRPSADDLQDPPRATLASAHPSLSQAIEFILNAPQAINDSFVHLNELTHHKVWLAVAQIRAIASGRGACEPPAGTDLGGWHFNPQTDSEAAPEAADDAADDAAGGPLGRRLLHSFTEEARGGAAPARGSPARAADPEPEHPVCSLVDELRFLRWLVTLLPQRFTAPLLRRMTVAALLKRRSLMPAYFSVKEQQEVTLLFLQFYVTHRGAAMKKSVVEFFHISKAGGTSMCSLSQKNGCTTWDAGEKRNCLVYEFDDLPHWVSKKSHLSLAPNRSQAGGAWFINFEADRNQVFCARRRHFMQMKGWDMYAHEYTLVGGRTSPRGVQLCTEMLTMLQVRHPYTRLVSHLRWVYGLYHERIQNTTAFWPNTTSAHWQYMAPPVVDNYYTRSLLGEAVYKLPAGRVTSEHGGWAQLLVAQYDVLLILEQLNSRKLGLGMGLGWRDIEQTEKHRSADELMAKIQAKQTNDAPTDLTVTDPTNIPDSGTVSTPTDAVTRRLLETDTQASPDDPIQSSHATDSNNPSVTGGDKMQSLLKAATSPGVPSDLGILLEMNQVDLHVYQFASWLARFDAAVLETVKVALGENAYAGLWLQGDVVKQRARREARMRKVKAEQYHEKMVAAAVARGVPVPPMRPHTAHITSANSTIDAQATCGFAGY